VKPIATAILSSVLAICAVVLIITGSPWWALAMLVTMLSLQEA